MKILIISHEYPPVGGGGANACRALAAEFAAAGDFVHVLTAGYRDTPFVENLYDGRLTITRVRSKRNSRDHCNAPEMLDYIRKASAEAESVLRHETFDICLCFFGIPGGILARRLKQRHGLRYIIRMGGGDIPGFQGRFRQLYKAVSPELRRIWRDADALVANSEGLRELAKAFCDSYPICVIPNGVDTEMYQPAKRNDNAGREHYSEPKQDDEPVRLLSVCRLIERKGLQDVIPVIRETEMRTGRRIHWTIAGDGPYLCELKKKATDNGVEERIDFIGRTEEEDLPVLYRSADIFVFPSYREGMPNAVLEAMSSGLPVILRKGCQGATELIKDNGALSDGDLADTLAEIINAGDEKWKEMGNAGRRTVLAEFTWKRIAESYNGLLKKIVKDA